MTITPISLAAGAGITDTSRLASKENLKEAATKFEAVFVGMMLKSMRATKLGEGLLDNNAMEQFRDMQDQRLASDMSAHAPLGLGEALSNFLSRGQPDLAADVKVPEASAVPREVTDEAS